MAEENDVEEVILHLTKSEVSQSGSTFIGRAQLSVMLPTPDIWQVLEKKIDGLRIRIRANITEEFMHALRDDNDNLHNELQKASDEIIRLRAELAVARNELNQLKAPHYMPR